MKGLTVEQIELLVSKGFTAEEMLAFARMGAVRSKAAERTARWRAKNKNVTESVTGDVTSDGHSDASPPPKENKSNPLPVSSETGLAVVPGRKRGTRLADDFEPPEDWIVWAMKKRSWSRADAIDEAECFARYWQAKPGREALKLDWPKTWQNWATNSRRQTGDGPIRRGGDPPSYLESYKRELAAGAPRQ